MLTAERALCHSADVKRLLLACLLLAACTSDPVPVASSPTPSPAATPSSGTTTSPTATPSPRASADQPDLLVAVVRRSGGVELFRVDRSTRVAVLERVLAPPAAAAKARDVTLSDGQACASWQTSPGDPSGTQPRFSLLCYPAGTSTGRVVDGVTQPTVIALSDDGTRLAWAQYDPDGNQVLETAGFTGGAVRDRRRFLARADRPETGPGAFDGWGIDALAWTDATTIAVSTLVESDDGPNLLLVDVASPRTRGWLDDGRPVRTPVKRYLTFDAVVSVAGGTALAVHRGSYLDDEPPPSQAVRLDLRTGRIREVLATAADRRDVIAVSGSPSASLYATKEQREDGVVRAYLRTSSESRGVPITGLPTDMSMALTRG